MQRMDQFDKKADRFVFLPMNVLSDGEERQPSISRYSESNDPPLLFFFSPLVSKADVALEDEDKKP